MTDHVITNEGSRGRNFQNSARVSKLLTRSLSVIFCKETECPDCFKYPRLEVICPCYFSLVGKFLIVSPIYRRGRHLMWSYELLKTCVLSDLLSDSSTYRGCFSNNSSMEDSEQRTLSMVFQRKKGLRCFHSVQESVSVFLFLITEIIAPTVV